MVLTIDFQALFERSPNAYMLLDRDFRYVAANAAYLEVTGSRLGDLLGRPLFDVFPNDPGNPDNESARLLRASFERVLKTGEADVIALIPYRVSRTGDQPGAEFRYWSATHIPILDESGAPAFLLQHAVEVTELQALKASPQRLQSEIAAQAERHRFLTESIPQQVWTAGPGGALDLVNRRVTEYFGTTEAEMLGAGWQSRIHPLDLDACIARWTHSLATGDDYEIEFRLLRADGTYRWHLGRAHPFRDTEGRVVKWFGTNTDMDDVKRTRDELQARSVLDRQLIGIVSHDLRNPLNAIGIGAALLKRGPLSDQQVKIVDRMMSSFERAGRLIRDFLDFTQARVSGRFPLTPSEANIRDIAQQVCDEVHPLYAGRHCRVEHSGREIGAWDPDRLTQLMGNLVSNALQHTPPGGTVTVRTEGGAEALVCSVHNSGEAIPEAEQSRLFRPFQRGKDAPASAAGNVGLGLYISQQITEAHGGTISVQSSPAAGTTFVFRLPYTVPTVPPA